MKYFSKAALAALANEVKELYGTHKKQKGSRLKILVLRTRRMTPALTNLTKNMKQSSQTLPSTMPSRQIQISNPYAYTQTAAQQCSLPDCENWCQPP